MKVLFIILLLLGGDPESFKSKLDNYLNGILKEYTLYEYEILSGPQGDNNEVTIDMKRELKINGNCGYVPVLIKNKHGVQTQAIVSIKLKLFKNAAIALKDIKRGQKLQPGDMEIRLVNVAEIRGMIFNSLNTINSFQAKTNIRRNEVLMSDMLEKAAIIKRGDKIAACVIKGSVRIDIDAIARQDGSENEIISIVTIDRKTFKARVIDQFSAIIVE